MGRNAGATNILLKYRDRRSARRGRARKTLESEERNSVLDEAGDRGFWIVTSEWLRFMHRRGNEDGTIAVSAEKLRNCKAVGPPVQRHVTGTAGIFKARAAVLRLVQKASSIGGTRAADVSAKICGRDGLGTERRIYARGPSKNI